MATSACLVMSTFVPAAGAITQALYNCGSCGSHILLIASERARVWKKEPLSTTLRKKTLTPRCCATLPESDQPYLKDLQFSETWAEPSVAAQNGCEERCIISGLTTSTVPSQPTWRSADDAPFNIQTESMEPFESKIITASQTLDTTLTCINRAFVLKGLSLAPNLVQTSSSQGF